jgi:HEAT repeat protein
MGKRRGAEEVLDDLAALRGKPASPETARAISAALGHKINFVAAKAADVARELNVDGLCGPLQEAFTRFLGGGAADRGCVATTAIARAAVELRCPAAELFNAGIRHVQKERPPDDAASELRGLCALGLVMSRDPEAIEKAADLLADPEPTSRAGAVRALAYAGHEDAALVLRFKALTGDKEPEVLAECFAALFQLAPQKSLAFVARFLDSNLETTREDAALAIGASRQPGAFALLRDRYLAGRNPSLAPMLLLGIATVRSPEAVQFLLARVEEESRSLAVEAIRAMGIFRHDQALRAKVSEIVDRRSDEMLRRAFEQMARG